MDRLIWINRLASLAVAIGYVIAAGVSEGWQADTFPFVIPLLVPLALIWFPEELGSYCGPLGRGHITCETPPGLMVFAGWFFLVGLPLIIGWLTTKA